MIYYGGNDFENPQIIPTSNVKINILSKLMRELLCKKIFSSFNDHDFDQEIGKEVLHSVQLMYVLIISGIRQQSSKLVL